VPSEPPVVCTDGSAGDHAASRLELGDLVDQEKGVAVRKDRLDLVLPEGDGRGLHAASLLAGSGD
jgi:hypothetical protein